MAKRTVDPLPNSMLHVPLTAEATSHASKPAPELAGEGGAAAAVVSQPLRRRLLISREADVPITASKLKGQRPNCQASGSVERWKGRFRKPKASLPLRKPGARTRSRALKSLLARWDYEIWVARIGRRSGGSWLFEGPLEFVTAWGRRERHRSSLDVYR